MFNLMYFNLQLLLQFPCHFEFNLTFLVKLAEHTYRLNFKLQSYLVFLSTKNLLYPSSNLFGTFLTNNLSERRRMRVRERTRSIWGYLRWARQMFLYIWALFKITYIASSGSAANFLLFHSAHPTVSQQTLKIATTVSTFYATESSSRNSGIETSPDDILVIFVDRVYFPHMNVSVCS